MSDVKNTTLWVTGKDLIAHISLEGDIEVRDGVRTERLPIAEAVTNTSVPIQLNSLVGYDPTSETAITMSFDLDITEWLNTLKLT